MIVRPAQPADLDAILAIARLCPEAPRWEPSAWGAYLDPAGSDPNGPRLLRSALVGESQGEAVGFAAASLLLDGEENRCELESIAVRPDLRRQGTGKALVRAVLDWSAHHGARSLALEVRAGNVPALRLYTGLGLQITGRRPRYYADSGEDALLLDIVVTRVSNPSHFSTRKTVEGGPPQC